MALAIELSNGWKTNMWYIGQELSLTYSQISFVESILADGDELDYILNKFSGIPKLSVDSRYLNNQGIIVPMREIATRGYVMRWFGDDAKFIVGNI
jgi:hypothetical protein